MSNITKLDVYKLQLALGVTDEELANTLTVIAMTASAMAAELRTETKDDKK